MYAIVHEDMVKEIEHLDSDTQAKVIAAYVKYQLFWVEPSSDDVLVYSIFKAKQFVLNQTKTKAEVARENGKKWWRPRKDLSVGNSPKTKKTQTKPNHNPEQTQKNQDNNIIYINNNILSNTESKDSDNNNITIKINELISELKDLTNEYGIAYDSKNERNFAKHILTATEFWAFAEKIWMSRIEFAKNILKASVLIKYWKWVCAWPMMIYQNYADVYNKSVQESVKRQKSTIPSF